MGRENPDLVGFRIALEHRQLPSAQLVLVLFRILRGDDELGLLILEGIGEVTVLQRRCIGREPTGPRGDGAVGVAGLFRAQRRQRSAELGRFFRRYSGHHTACQQGEGQDTE